MHLVRLDDEGVGIKPDRKNGMWHHMGSVMLSDVTFSMNTLKGNLLDEWTEEREPEEAILKMLVRKVFFNGQRFVTMQGKKYESVVGKSFKAVYICGHNIYVR